MGNFSLLLWAISFWFRHWKNFKNWPTFAKVTVKIKVAQFFWLTVYKSYLFEHRDIFTYVMMPSNQCYVCDSETKKLHCHMFARSLWILQKLLYIFLIAYSNSPCHQHISTLDNFFINQLIDWSTNACYMCNQGYMCSTLSFGSSDSSQVESPCDGHVHFLLLSQQVSSISWVTGLTSYQSTHITDTHKW